MYSIVEKNFPEPVGFDQIRSRYLETVQAFDEFSIPRKKIRDSALVRVLLYLIEGGAIVRAFDGRYTLAVVGPSNQEVRTAWTYASWVRGENPRSCMSSSMCWRSGVMASPFRAAAGTARIRMRRDVTRWACEGNDREHAFGYPPKAD